MGSSLAIGLAWRFMSHASNGFARFVTWVSFIGLTLGVTILTLVVTVMNGFDAELRSRLLSSVPHITVAASEVSTPLRESIAVRTDVGSWGDFYRGTGALVTATRAQPIAIYALTPGAGYPRSLAPSDRNGVVLGAPLARALGLLPGDSLQIMTAEVVGERIRPVLIQAQLTRVFQLGAEPDYNLVVLHHDRFPQARWQRMGEAGLQIQLKDPMQVQMAVAQLKKEHPETEFTSWQRQYGELFQAVQLEKAMMFVLLLLVVAIAAFNIVAGQSMLVNDKRESIAILRTMGMGQRTLLQAFLAIGGLISVIGTLLGLILGVLASFQINEILDVVEQVTGMHLLDGSLFVEVPAQVLPLDLLLIASLSCGLCLLSAWFPARRAAQVDPVSALH